MSDIIDPVLRNFEARVEKIILIELLSNKNLVEVEEMQEEGFEMNKNCKMETAEKNDFVDEERSVKMDKNGKMENDDAVDEPAKMVLISNEGGRNEVAKDLLLQSSDYFQALANSGMRDANFKELTLECLSDACLHEVEHFLSNVQSNEDHFGARDLCYVEKGLEGSLYLQIQSMTDKYLNNLFELLNESTYARILQFANKFAVFGAIERVFEFIFDNFKCIISRSEILSLSPDGMIRLVESELVNAVRELDIFDLIIRWTAADESREQYAKQLFRKVRYNLMAVHEKMKAKKVLKKLEINIRSKGHGFRTVGTILGFGYSRFKIGSPKIGCSLSIYDFLKTITNKANQSPVVVFKPTKIWRQSSHFRNYSSHRVCAANNRIYFAGGYYRYNLPKDLVKVYNTITRKWSRLSNMLVARGFFYFGEMGGHLYAVAGEGVTGENTRTVERYAPDKDKWKIIAPLPIAVLAPSGTARNGMLYVSGGMISYRNPANKMYMYKPALKQWFEKAPMLAGRYDHAMAALGDKIFVFGGNCLRIVNGLESFELSAHDGEMFDCKAEQWTQILRNKVPSYSVRHHMLINDSLFCFFHDLGKPHYSILEIKLKKATILMQQDFINTDVPGFSEESRLKCVSLFSMKAMPYSRLKHGYPWAEIILKTCLLSGVQLSLLHTYMNTLFVDQVLRLPRGTVMIV
ncbi:hypothetical protein HELRODRAFT_189553 [Helobdella robusta]|uniref:BACK domain-containing protein n=1 Tax=Helobdella robusta TaxID=6412 RepID=T1FR52_HELRO|nr:hypothetical protein HELRODRAFT_189553 [Helobdella robusta]ESN92650.1 hypothetical protein HELRODRAFT_189553 [Helobdella robusta]